MTASATTIAVSARPAISTQAGTGVERRRFRTPASRSAVIEMTRFTNEAAITPSAEPRHVVGRGLDVLRPDPVVAEDADEDDEEEDRQDEREEARLPVAQEAEQVEARLVQDEAGRGHARSSV